MRHQIAVQPDELKIGALAQPVGEDVSTEIEEIFEMLPDQQKERVQKLVVEQSFGMMGIGRLTPENEIAKKITEDHITKYLDGSERNMQNSYKERHESKIFNGILVFMAPAFFIAVIVLLKDNVDVLEKIIYSIAGLVAGAFGGYEFGRHKKSSDD